MEWGGVQKSLLNKKELKRILHKKSPENKKTSRNGGRFHVSDGGATDTARERKKTGWGNLGGQPRSWVKPFVQPKIQTLQKTSGLKTEESRNCGIQREEKKEFLSRERDLSKNLRIKTTGTREDGGVKQ